LSKLSSCAPIIVPPETTEVLRNGGHPFSRRNIFVLTSKRKTEKKSMPEGDTIHRTAVNLRAALDGRVIVRAESRCGDLEVESLRGRQIAATEARGKHLLVFFEDGGAIHSHMGMTGSWHLYRPKQPWQKPAKWAELALFLEQTTCVCFTPKTLELLTAAGVRRHPHLARLGPDLLSTAFRPELALGRIRQHDAAPLGEAVMNQTLVCGIGNVYKSELLFLERLCPFQAVGSVEDARWIELLMRAQKLMKKNLEGYPRRTRFGGDGQRLWVYGRGGERCLKCGDTILMQRQGDAGRSTYWCPTCQGRP
jgi:endonuclease-8